MNNKCCAACGQPFRPCHQVPQQCYCSAPACLPERATAALAARQAEARSGLSRQPGASAEGLEQAQSRLLARIPRNASRIYRTQSHTATRAQQPDAKSRNCKDGRVNSRIAPAGKIREYAVHRGIEIVALVFRALNRRREQFPLHQLA